MVPYLQGFHNNWLTNFPDFSSIFSIFQYIFLIFPVFWVKIPDFSRTVKYSPVFFPGFPVRLGTLAESGR